jgi:hypothetical protein
MRVGILLLVVAALLLLWLVVGWRGGVDPRNYEVEYAVAAVYETATGRRVVEVARWVSGRWRGELHRVSAADGHVGIYALRGY